MGQGVSHQGGGEDGRDLGSHGSRSLVDVRPTVAVMVPPGGGDRPPSGHASLEVLSGRMPAPAVRLDGDPEIRPGLVEAERFALGHDGLVLQDGRWHRTLLDEPLQAQLEHAGNAFAREAGLHHGP